MFRLCCKRYVVFTQAIPYLQKFSKDFFLKGHPLSSSNIWLDENDFFVNQSTSHFGKSSLLKINSLSHHPKYSPYAKCVNKRKYKKTTPSASSPSLEVPCVDPDTKPINCPNARKKRAGDVVEQSIKVKSLDLNYKIPVCSVYIYRHMYLLNMDQIMEDTQNRQELFLSEFKTSPGMEVSMSINSRRPFSFFIQKQLQQLQQIHRYNSCWWGTMVQWRRLGAALQFSQNQHLLYQKIYTKLVHISLIDNAEEILQHCYISGKSGTFFNLLLKNNPDNKLDSAYCDSSLGHMQGGMQMGVSNFDVQGISPARGSIHGATGDMTHNCYSSSLFGHSSYFFNIMNDMKLHRHAVPLYFSMTQLHQFKLKLRGDASGVSFNEYDNTIPPSLKHLDQAQDENLFYQGFSGAMSPKTYFYHLSQVYFPESFRLPQHVIAAELEYTVGSPLNGLTGAHLPYVELLKENLLLQYPNLAAVLCASRHSGPGATECSPHLSAQIAAKDSVQALSDDALAELLEKRSLPTVHDGRSLWFSAKDILQHGGIVDVNATPVEVTCLKALTYAHVSNNNYVERGGENYLGIKAHEQCFRRMMYNVDCLVNPDEGYKVVNQCPFLRNDH
ncbi:unnamed protein product [Phytomonas sp. Hart1]|nr:unnamed protein product [Phytomonas sp. Hart1]|eukprot:CCW68297.1 unnamed protein product [Phytomonas sp. isolate Hart1]